MEILTENYIMWAQQCAECLKITFIQLEEGSYRCKYSIILDIQKMKMLASFGSLKSLLGLMGSPNNYLVDFKNKTFTLKWKICTQYFMKDFTCNLKLQLQELNEKEILQSEIIMLKRKISRFQQKQERGQFAENACPQPLRLNSQEKSDRESQKSNQNQSQSSSLPTIKKKNIQKEIKKARPNNPEDQPRDESKKKVGTNAEKRKYEGKKRGRKSKSEKKDAATSQVQKQQKELPPRKKSPKKLTQSPTSVKSKITGQIQNNRPQKVTKNLATQYRNCRATQKHGDKVRLDFENGDYYFGQTKNHLYDGYGIYFSVENGTYEGEWKDGKGSGYGVSVDNDGNRHEGMYENDLKNGQGTEIFSNGEKYVGNFKDSSREGYGVYYFEDGGIYEGEWKEDLQDGYGKFTSPNGTVYEGNWRKDEKDGPGVLNTPHGKINQVWQMGFLISPGFVKIEEPIKQ